MTISPDPSGVRTRNDGTSTARDDEQVPNREPNPPFDERAGDGGERRTLLRLAGRVLGSWGLTVRLIAILIVIVGGLWLLNATVDLGPIRLGKP